jgi:hypothetical protein
MDDPSCISFEQVSAWRSTSARSKGPKATQNAQVGHVEVGLLEACLTELVLFWQYPHPSVWDAHVTRPGRPSADNQRSTRAVVFDSKDQLVLSWRQMN